MAGNTSLGAAKAAKNDEFYTQWNDIKNEIQAYLEYDPDVFRGKVVLLPCDDPESSNFTKYFALNFNKLGLKKLISTSYVPCRKGRIYVIEQGADLNDGANLNKGYLKWDYLEDDGDFRSDEVTKLRDEADMVITNPPYSLFREFIAWLIEGNVEFAVIGNMNAVTCKEVFPLFKENRLWRGATPDNGRIKWFRIPDDAPAKSSVQRTDPDGTRWQDVGNSVWFTNIEHGRRHEPLALMTMENNLLHGSKRVRDAAYVKYDNYDAIEVPETKGIPSDYSGIMGVPVSFLDKYNPEQFEIVGRGGDVEWAENECTFFTPPAKEQQHKHRAANKTWRVQNAYVLNDEGLAQTIYQRIFIRHRNPERKEPQPLRRSWGAQSSLRCKRGFSHVEVRG